MKISFLRKWPIFQVSALVCQFLNAYPSFCNPTEIPIQGEQGPLEMDREISFKSSPDSPQAYRIETYPLPKVLEIEINSDEKMRPSFKIEGPLPNNGDTTPIGSGPIYTEERNLSNASKIKSQLNLNLPGVYRIIFQSESSGRTQIKASCLKGCYREKILVSELFAQLKSQNLLDEHLVRALHQFTGGGEQSFINYFLLNNDAFLNAQDYKKLDHFPIIPIHQFGKFRTLLANTHTHQPIHADEVIHGKLENLLGPCLFERPGLENLNWPKGFSEDFKRDFKYGHFPDLSLTACQTTHSNSFAKILTSLSVGNHSSVIYQETEYNSPETLVRALIESGHEVRLCEERTFANFLSIAVGDKSDLQWPVWLDTGWEVAGKPLIIPAGHSQHVWWISGPVVNARVSVFLGITGAGFFGQTDTRPGWTGRRAVFDKSSNASDPAERKQTRTEIETALIGAKLYLQKNRIERSSIASGMFADGYGYLGDCNDSDAAIEMFQKGTFSAYPLFRDRRLDLQSAPDDILGNLMKGLPDDTSPTGRDRKNEFQRVLGMLPYPIESGLWFDKELQAQMRAIEQELRSL